MCREVKHKYNLGSFVRKPKEMLFFQNPSFFFFFFWKAQNLQSWKWPQQSPSPAPSFYRWGNSGPERWLALLPIHPADLVRFPPGVTRPIPSLRVYEQKHTALHLEPRRKALCSAFQEHKESRISFSQLCAWEKVKPHDRGTNIRWLGCNVRWR